MRESAVKKYMVKRVKELGGEVRQVKWLGRSNAPDCRVMLPAPRECCWVEMKSPETIKTFPANAHERAQAREHKRMTTHGELVFVLGTIEQVEEMLA
jgi:hypothetical protein